MTRATNAPTRGLSADVVRFGEDHGLMPYLELAIRLAKSTFDHVTNVRVEVDTDPETDEEALVVIISVTAGVDDVVRFKKSYTRQWVDAVPANSREKIRLLYDII